MERKVVENTSEKVLELLKGFFHVGDAHKSERYLAKKMLEAFKIVFPKKHNYEDYIIPARLLSMPIDAKWNDNASQSIKKMVLVLFQVLDYESLFRFSSFT